MRSFLYTMCLAGVLVGCNVEPMDLNQILQQLTQGYTATSSGGPGQTQQINWGWDAGQLAPGVGAEITLLLISDNTVPANVVVQFWVLDVEVRHTEVQIPAFAESVTIGPDYATWVVIEAAYHTGQKMRIAVLALAGVNLPPEYAGNSDLIILFENGDLKEVYIPDPDDGCPQDPDKTDPGLCGCGAPETDDDGDGVPDCADQCPGAPDVDTDGDGLLDCHDQCPQDPDKADPGICGCGLADVDTDGDGVYDCHDGCPEDPEKTDPGVCGCGVPDVDENHNGVYDCEEPPPGGGSTGGNGITDCNSNGIPDECDIECGDTGGPCDLPGCGQSQDCNENEVPDECDIASGTSQDLNENGIPDECECQEPIIYVKQSAEGANDGTSWTDAYNDLQDALDDLAGAKGQAPMIWVAGGTYRPSREVVPAQPRSAAFLIEAGVPAVLLGGFLGTDDQPALRDPSYYVSFLSGDLSGNDGPDFTGNEENSVHVIVVPPGAELALDGFTVTAGNADADQPIPAPDMGGGMYLQDGFAFLTNTRFTGNCADAGGGICMQGSSSVLSAWNCRFQGNVAWEGAGGAVYATASDGPLYAATVEITPLLQLNNCLFSGNLASIKGGAVAAEWVSAFLVNCTVSGNVALYGAGGGLNTNASGQITNSIFWGNLGYGDDLRAAQIYYWGDVPPIVQYTCVQDEYPGDGDVYPGPANIDADPQFLRNPNDGGDGWGTGANDDFGDLHLQTGSPCIDAGDNPAASWPQDLDGNPRIADGDGNGSRIVDLGAYEREPQPRP